MGLVGLFILLQIMSKPKCERSKFLLGIPILLAVSGLAFLAYDFVQVVDAKQDGLTKFLAWIGICCFLMTHWLFLV